MATDYSPASDFNSRLTREFWERIGDSKRWGDEVEKRIEECFDAFMYDESLITTRARYLGSHSRKALYATCHAFADAFCAALPTEGDVILPPVVSTPLFEQLVPECAP